VPWTPGCRARAVLEDVDLIAEERTRQEPGCTTLLFELLNEMDGLADDVDVVFVLTTNRPERSWSRTAISTRPSWSWRSRAATSPSGCSGRPPS
jgi:hypothetical protein